MEGLEQERLEPGGSRNAGKRGLKSHARGNTEEPAGKPALLGDTGGVLPTSGGRKALSTCTMCALDGEIRDVFKISKTNY